MGLSLEALLAGYIPKNMPIDIETNIAMAIERGSTEEGRGVALETSLAIMNPKKIPMIPPIVERVTASMRN